MIATTTSTMPRIAAGMISLRRVVFIVAMVEHDSDREGWSTIAPARRLQRVMSPSLGSMPIPKTPQKMFETRSHAWKEVGLLRQIDARVVKRARLEALLLVPLFIAVVALYDNRVSLLGTKVRRPHGKSELVLESALETPIRVLTVILLGA